jgi:hypothetical protein
MIELNMQEMITGLQFLYKDKYLIVTFSASLILLFLSFVFAIFHLWGTGNLLIIHFDAYKVVDFWGGHFVVFGIVITSGILILINIFLASILYYKERFISFVLGFFSLGFAILIFVTIAFIISIN